jgi:hypothetical protein
MGTGVGHASWAVAVEQLRVANWSWVQMDAAHTVAFLTHIGSDRQLSHPTLTRTTARARINHTLGRQEIRTTGVPAS